MEGADLCVIDDRVPRRGGEVQRVDRDRADDQVALRQARSPQDPLQPLAGLAGERAAREHVVLRRLVGEDDEAELLEAAAIDRTDAERWMQSDAEPREVGPR